MGNKDTTQECINCDGIDTTSKSNSWIGKWRREMNYIGHEGGMDMMMRQILISVLLINGKDREFRTEFKEDLSQIHYPIFNSQDEFLHRLMGSVGNTETNERWLYKRLKEYGDYKADKHKRDVKYKMIKPKVKPTAEQEKIDDEYSVGLGRIYHEIISRFESQIGELKEEIRSLKENKR